MKLRLPKSLVTLWIAAILAAAGLFLVLLVPFFLIFGKSISPGQLVGALVGIPLAVAGYRAYKRGARRVIARLGQQRGETLAAEFCLSAMTMALAAIGDSIAVGSAVLRGAFPRHLPVLLVLFFMTAQHYWASHRKLVRALRDAAPTKEPAAAASDGTAAAEERGPDQEPGLEVPAPSLV